MDAVDFIREKAYWLLEPYGVEVQMMGEICSAIYHALCGGQKREGRDFIPIPRVHVPESPADIEAKLLAALGKRNG